MAIELTVTRKNAKLSDDSEVFTLLLRQNLTSLKDVAEMCVDCVDEAHQDRLIVDLKLAGFRLVG